MTSLLLHPLSPLPADFFLALSPSSCSPVASLSLPLFPPSHSPFLWVDAWHWSHFLCVLCITLKYRIEWDLRFTEDNKTRISFGSYRWALHTGQPGFQALGSGSYIHSTFLYCITMTWARCSPGSGFWPLSANSWAPTSAIQAATGFPTAHVLSGIKTKILLYAARDTANKEKRKVQPPVVVCLVLASPTTMQSWWQPFGPDSFVPLWVRISIYSLMTRDPTHTSWTGRRPQKQRWDRDRQIFLECSH